MTHMNQNQGSAFDRARRALNQAMGLPMDESGSIAVDQALSTAEEHLADLLDKLGTIFLARQIRLSNRVILAADNCGRITVVNGHPQGEEIETLFMEDSDLAGDFRHVEWLVRSAENARDSLAHGDGEERSIVRRCYQRIGFNGTAPQLHLSVADEGTAAFFQRLH